MDSWFGKLREKVIVDKVDEELDSDEERKRKEEQMKDTLRKLNTDEVLNDDDIERISESRRPPKELTVSKVETPSPIAETQSNILQKSGGEANAPNVAVAASDDAPPTSVVRIIEDEEHFESQFWD